MTEARYSRPFAGGPAGVGLRPAPPPLAQLDGVASGVLEAVSVHRVLSDDPTSRAPHEQCIPCS